MTRGRKKIRIGILTGGGDCPGLNAVIRAVVRRSARANAEVIGLIDGWKGLLEENYKELNLASVSGILPQGGTILGTSRTNALKDERTIKQVFKKFKKLNLHALIAVGGEGTLTVSARLAHLGLPLVGVPKTIDNDINATDTTFGFNTAVEVATAAIDRLHTTAESHRRVMVIEVMGRHAGWIAVYSGIAGGADAILIPENPLSVEEISDIIRKREKRGKSFSIIVAAEGAPLVRRGKSKLIAKSRKDAFGRPQLGGIGQALADAIEDETSLEARVTVLGHVQRGGTPSAYDRVLATRLGAFATDLAINEQWGQMAALSGTKIVAVPLDAATKTLKTIDADHWELAQSLFA